MREVTLEDQTELGELLRSGATVMPPHRQSTYSFSFEAPPFREGQRRATVRLATTDILFAGVQVFRPGHGERVMHSHAGMDGFWMVLSGSVTFHFIDGSTRHLGKHEGICIPRNVNYWFVAGGEAPLELLQVDAIHPQIQNDATAINASDEDIRESLEGMVFFDAQTENEN